MLHVEHNMFGTEVKRRNHLGSVWIHGFEIHKDLSNNIYFEVI